MCGVRLAGLGPRTYTGRYMHIGQLVVRNSLRSPLRTLMTVLTVAIMLAAFVFPRTLVDQQDEAVREAAHDRIIILPKRGWTQGLPARYADEVRGAEGIKTAVGVAYAGFKLPGHDEVFLGSNAVEPEPLIAMHHEIVAPEAEKRAFLEDERSVLVSRDLARERGWKVGDRLIFESWVGPGKWEVTVACIYEAVGASWAKRMVWAHYGFFNRGLPIDKRDKLSFISAQVLDPSRGGSIARALDLHFDAEAVRTLSMEDEVLSAASVGRLSAVLNALDLVSYLILFVVMAILMNTLSLNVRERTREFGVLRAIGFGPRQVCALVLAEAALLGLAGAGLGLLLSYALIEGFVSPYLVENLQFSEVEVPLRIAVTGVIAGVSLALAAAVVPALRIGRLEVRDALGRLT